MKKYLLFFVLLSIEIFGFSDAFKYQLFPNEVIPWVVSNFLVVKIGVVLVLSIINWGLWKSLNKKQKTPLFIVFLLKGFQAKGSDLLGLLNILYTLCHIAWIGDELLSGEVANAIIRFDFLLIYPLLVAFWLLKENQETPTTGPMVLISPLSRPDKKNIIATQEEIKTNEYYLGENRVTNKEKNEEIKKQYFDKVDYFRAWGNFDSIRKSILKHGGSLELIVLLISDEVLLGTDDKKDGLVHFQGEEKQYLPQNIIKTFLSEVVHKNVEVVLSTDIKATFKGNDMTSTGFALDKILTYLFKEKKYEDKDVIFNITSGTAISSGAMILKAIPSDRRAEYVNQDTGEVEEVKLDIFEIKDLWEELIEKIA